MAESSQVGAQSKAHATSSHILRSALDNITRIRSTFQGFDDGIRAFTQAVEARLELVHEYAVSADGYIDSLEGRLSELQRQREQLANRLDAAEMQTARLLSLYVATSQLHSTLDPETVRRMIAEITINLLGADHFALLLCDSDEPECWRLALAEGSSDVLTSLLRDGAYRGGDPMVDSCLRDGVIRLASDAPSNFIAAVPLLVNGDVVGVLLLLKLLDHKKELTVDDRELMELLAMHAASALVLAQTYTNADRKLRTLESLVSLVRRHGTGEEDPTLIDALLKSKEPRDPR